MPDTYIFSLVSRDVMLGLRDVETYTRGKVLTHKTDHDLDNMLPLHDLDLSG